MLKLISQKKADGIICWKLDRLARNPIDGGQIIWMLQKGVIKNIQSFDRAYSPEDNVLLMNVEFGMANQFILDLSKNVRRGMKTKVEKGWLPTVAPLGYLNDRSRERGKKEILRDPDRFALVKKMWRMMLSGNYSAPKIANIVCQEWGLRNRKGKLLSESAIYRLFANPFYSGRFEYPIGSGNWYQGCHEPMINNEEFEKVQVILGRNGKPRLKKHEFAFTGLVRCGECGAMITAEEKNQIICSKCKYKFSSNNKSECPRCNTPIEDMRRPKILHYVYYHCTKKTNPQCSQGAIETLELEKQITKRLATIHISEDFKDWAVEYLREELKKDTHSLEAIFASQRNAYQSCVKKLENLLQLKISPLNSDGSLLSDEDFGKQKSELQKEKTRLEESMSSRSADPEKWREAGKKVFTFACYAKYWFKKGSPQERFRILKSLGSNLTLKEKKLLIDLLFPFEAIGEIASGVPQARDGFEPKILGLNKGSLGILYARSPIVQSAMKEVRTWLDKNYEGVFVPVLDKPPNLQVLNLF